MRWPKQLAQWRIVTAAAPIVVAAIVVTASHHASALTFGGEDNVPHDEPGWPSGAANIFNNAARIAWWENFGQWVSEFRSDTKTLNGVLQEFAKAASKRKRIVVRDGTGRSYWINLNADSNKDKSARMDWNFLVWQSNAWIRQCKLPIDLRPADVNRADDGPPAEINIFTGGNIRWSDVVVPIGIEVDDQRLEAHGFSLKDGIVLEGTIFDLSTQSPLSGQVRLEHIEPKSGSYHYTAVAKTTADAQGHWILKGAPAGWHRIVCDADGYVSRVVGYTPSENEPMWRSYCGRLLKPAVVTGKVTDETGKPLQDVQVRLENVGSDRGERYDSPDGYSCRTDDKGKLNLDQVPQGQATVVIHKSGYCRPGLGMPITTPSSDLALEMKRSAHVIVTVDFSMTARPLDYIVELEPETGNRVGSWGGSGEINRQNQITFDDVPPGRYILYGHPNPTTQDEKTEPTTFELVGGQYPEIKLTAK